MMEKEIYYICKSCSFVTDIEVGACKCGSTKIASFNWSEYKAGSAAYVVFALLMTIAIIAIPTYLSSQGYYVVVGCIWFLLAIPAVYSMVVNIRGLLDRHKYIRDIKK